MPTLTVQVGDHLDTTIEVPTRQIVTRFPPYDTYTSIVDSWSGDDPSGQPMDTRSSLGFGFGCSTTLRQPMKRSQRTTLLIRNNQYYWYSRRPLQHTDSTNTSSIGRIARPLE